MYRSGVAAGALAIALCSAPAWAGSVDVTVDSHVGPWSQASNPALDYGVHDNTGPTVVAVTPGENLTISYLSGLTSAFGGTPTVDANGYVGGAFGSGVGLSGIGSSGTPFPSFFIDPTNTGPDIWLAELIGDFATGGVVVGTPFAIGDGPFAIMVPAGVTQLQLGVNDDIYSDNTGSLLIQVAGVSGVPEPATWTLLTIGVFGLGALLRNRR